MHRTRSRADAGQPHLRRPVPRGLPLAAQAVDPVGAEMVAKLKFEIDRRRKHKQIRAYGT
jgi:hypothetical protein